MSCPQCGDLGKVEVQRGRRTARVACSCRLDTLSAHLDRLERELVEMRRAHEAGCRCLLAPVIAGGRDHCEPPP